MGVHIIAYRTIAVAADDLELGRAVFAGLIDAVCIDSTHHVRIDIIEGCRLRVILRCDSGTRSCCDVCGGGRLLCRVACNADIVLIDFVGIPVFLEEGLIGIIDGRLCALIVLDGDGWTIEIPIFQEAMGAGILVGRIRCIGIHSDQGIGVRRARIRILQAVGARAVVGVVELGLLDGQCAAVVDGVVLVRRGQAGDLGIRDVVDACIEICIGSDIAEEMLQVVASRRTRR